MKILYFFLYNIFIYQAWCLKCYDPNCHKYSFCNTEVNECQCANVFSSTAGPVCGSDGRNYTSMDQLELFACKENRSIEAVKRGMCYGCNDQRCHPYSECKADVNLCVCKPILDIYGPVCGSDNKMYISEYELDAKACYDDDNVTVAYKGFCAGPGICGYHLCHNYSSCDPFTNECVCDDTVNATYSPVCGSDGETYGNRVILEAHSCIENITLTVVHQGKCEAAIPRCGDPRCHKYSYCDYENTKLCVCPTYNEKNVSTVCGTDRKEYLNVFQLEEMACKANRNIDVAYPGKCNEEIREDKQNLVIILVSIFVSVLAIAIITTFIGICYKMKKKKLTSSSDATTTATEIPLMT